MAEVGWRLRAVPHILSPSPNFLLRVCFPGTCRSFIPAYFNKKKKKNNTPHRILQLLCWPAFHSRGIEVHEACSAAVDPPEELAVYGLCQNDIKDIRLRAEDVVAAVRRSIPSLSLLLTPLSATQQAYWWGQQHSYSVRLSSPVAAVWTWAIFKAKSCKSSLAVILMRNPHVEVFCLFL